MPSHKMPSNQNTIPKTTHLPRIPFHAGSRTNVYKLSVPSRWLLNSMRASEGWGNLFWGEGETFSHMFSTFSSRTRLPIFIYTVLHRNPAVPRILLVKAYIARFGLHPDGLEEFRACRCLPKADF